MEKVTKKYAIVTGASSGIGWHISKELAMKGYSLVAVSNQPKELLELKTSLEKDYGIAVLTMNCDLAQKEAAQEVFDYCQHKQLPIEVLVNNAGFLIYGEVTNVDPSRVENILQLHMNTPALLCRLFGAIMAKNKSGYILNVSSISAAMPYPIISLYGPTKTFLRNFSRALRIELKETGVWVSCLMPGATATALYDKDKINIPLAIKLGVMKKPEQVAKAAVVALFKKKGECVPGVLNKLTMISVPFIPMFVIGLVYKLYLRREAKKKSKA